MNKPMIIGAAITAAIAGAVTYAEYDGLVNYTPFGNSLTDTLNRVVENSSLYDADNSDRITLFLGIEDLHADGASRKCLGNAATEFIREGRRTNQYFINYARGHCL